VSGYIVKYSKFSFYDIITVIKTIVMIIIIYFKQSVIFKMFFNQWNVYCYNIRTQFLE
jgi:hypothetical protein